MLDETLQPKIIKKKRKLLVVCDEEREQSQGSEAAMRITKSLFYGGNSRSAPKLV